MNPKLEGVHPDLVKLYLEVEKVSPVKLMVIQGLRTKAEQKKLVAMGKSQTVNSRHLTGHAVDFGCMVNGKLTWEYKYYEQVGAVFKKVAKNLGIPIVWGGDWKTIKDGDHIELDRKVYK